MSKTLRSRKGVTLAEIVVALALVAIMSTMVVSFVIIISRRTQANAVNDAMRRDCMLIEATADHWLYAADQNQEEPDVEDLLDFIQNSLDLETVDVQTISKANITMFENGEDKLFILSIPVGEDIFKICVNSRIDEKRGATVVIPEETPAT